MPHPHEQKLHEVVNSLTFESFRSLVAARIAGTSSRPPIASPAPLPTVSLNRSLRVRVDLEASSGLSMAVLPGGWAANCRTPAGRPPPVYSEFWRIAASISGNQGPPSGIPEVRSGMDVGQGLAAMRYSRRAVAR